ncbi:MAG: FMN-binding protein [Clostridiales Family XIII bacterium]|jgi:major membrane immunogen (membrane-anchored lipoprotein)|nr:FMN-binding protein [Clostridiales Family XIII bacterium]
MSKKVSYVSVVLAVVCLLSVFVTGCGGGGSGSGGAVADVSAGDYPDGVYTGKSSEDENGAYGEVTITIEDGKVTDCAYVTWQKDGSIKDEDYGKVNGEISNQDYYDKAQLAVEAMSQYASQFAETGDLAKVDAVSGATNSYNQFSEAVADALKG